MDSTIELSPTDVLRVLTLAPPSGSCPLAEAAQGAQLLEADRVAL